MLYQQTTLTIHPRREASYMYRSKLRNRNRAAAHATIPGMLKLTGLLGWDVFLQ